MKHEAIARTPIAGPQWNNYFEFILAWHACRAKPLRAKEPFGKQPAQIRQVKTDQLLELKESNPLKSGDQNLEQYIIRFKQIAHVSLVHVQLQEDN